MRSVLLALLLFAAVLPAATARADAPTPTALPGLTGTPREGQKLTSTEGSWTGTGPMTFTRRWLRCDVAGDACTTILGAWAATYTLTALDVGGTIRVEVTASNIDGEESATSAASPVIGPLQPPVNTGPPAITGTPRDALPLSADDGTWTGIEPITATRRWLRCDAAGDDCTPLSATGTSYTPTGADVGRTLRVEVTAKNADGTTTATSVPTAIVAPAPPANTALPTISGAARDGQPFTSTTGSWTGTATITYTRRWQRCDATGSACADIPGATSTQYVAGPADVGGTVRVTVTATNAADSASATSAPSPVVGPKQPPVNTDAPALTGDAIDGAKLTVSHGTWTGVAPISYARSWLRCDAGGANCAPLGATGTTYTLKPEDVGSTIAVEVSATNPDGTGVETTAPTAVVAPAVPTSTSAPAITGAAREGQLLSASTGTWKGTPTITYAYEWRRCTGATCAPIPGATAAGYRLTAADVGATIRVAVTASNAGGDTTEVSSPTATVDEGEPVAVTLPEVSGPLPRDGQDWTGTLGTWAGTAPLTHGRQWLRCNSSGSACSVISGAISATYRLTAADVGRTVRFEVTAANAHGVTKVQSPPSPVIAAAPPTADATPVVAGEARDGRTLTIEGTWSGTPPITYTYAWERCAALVLTCTPIPGATAATYTLTPDDVGSRVRVRIGASNAGGGGAATSDPSAVVLHDPPRAIATPTLSGAAVEGRSFSVGTGVFAGTQPIAVTVRWQRCDSVGAGCADIPGATGTTRVLDADDRGSTLRAVLTATNPEGSVVASTAPSAVVAAAPPHNTIPPAVSPSTDLRDGRELTASQGAWEGSQPMTFTYQWQRCNASGAACTPITGAADPTYRLTTADVNATVRVVVSASGPGGGASQPSAVTGVVLANPPKNTVAPVLSGVARDGLELEVSDGSWTGLVPFTTSYRWWRCDAAGENCGEIAGETGARYRLRSADVGLTVRAQVLQTNAGGTTGAMSGASGVVAPAGPSVVVGPQVVGPAAVGRTVIAEKGTWAGTPPMSFSYQWQRCEADGSACADIPGATGAGYLLTMADDQKTVRFVVTASNTVGPATATSPTTAEISDDPPVPVVQPSISADGLVADGTMLEADPGAWSGAQPIDLVYQWRRCDAALNGCVDVPGATSSSYELGSADVGKRLVVVVTATNVVDVAVATSEGTPVVAAAPPTNVGAPTISVSGGVRDGARLTATNGTWKGATPMSFATTWLRCDTAGDACAPIPGASGNSYTLGPADVGHRIRARVTATNATTDVSHDSAPTQVVSALAPSNATRPSVVVLDGKPAVGGRVRGIAGTWNGTGPVDLSLRWQRCYGTSTAACDDIPGATGTEYVLTESDVGRRIRIVVVASNAAGSAVAESTTSATVPATPPANVTPPVLYGGPAVQGAAVGTTAGVWTGSATIVHEFQWERCSKPGASSCPKINGANGPTYTLTEGDVGKFVRATVTAVNGGGKESVSTGLTAEVAGIAPVPVAPPVASAKGGIKVGATLTATSGKWAGTNPIKYATRWQRCDARGHSCVDLPGGDRSSYKLTAEDVDGSNLKAPLRAVVTATNVAGSTEAASAALGVTAGAAAAGGGAGGGGGTSGTRKRTPRSKVAAALRRVRLTASGQLWITLSCPKKSRGACGITGSIAGGKIRRGVSIDGIRRGRTATKRYRLTSAQKRYLRRKRTVRFVLRLAAPATPTRSKVTRKTVRVPSKLSGLGSKSSSKRSSCRRLEGKARKRCVAKAKRAKKSKKKSTRRGS